MEKRNKHTVEWSSEKFGIENHEEGLMSNFFEDEDCYRARDVWGHDGWVVGYREWVPSPIQSHKPSGFGGQLLFLQDGPLHTIYGVDKSKIKRI